jgi:hypothetical protein
MAIECKGEVFIMTMTDLMPIPDGRDLVAG